MKRADRHVDDDDPGRVPLSEVESSLRRLVPRKTSVRRDDVIFAAGQRAGAATQRRNHLVQHAFACVTTAALSIALTIAWQTAEPSMSASAKATASDAFPLVRRTPTSVALIERAASSVSEVQPPIDRAGGPMPPLFALRDAVIDRGLAALPQTASQSTFASPDATLWSLRATLPN